LQLWRFHGEAPSWTAGVDGVSKIGWISPTATKLATLHDINHRSRICVWTARTGQLDAQLDVIQPPLDIEFIGNSLFSLHYDNYTENYSTNPFEFAYRATANNPLPNQSQEMGHLSLDDAHEWIVSGLERICWIPSGYIGSTQSSYCWAGSSLFMVGKDGTLRTLTFSQPS